MRYNFLIFSMMIFLYSCVCNEQLEKKTTEDFIETPIYYTKILAFAPDRFNTGCDERKLTTMTENDFYGRVTDCNENNSKQAFFNVRNNDIVINAYANKQMADKIIINDINFTKKLMPTNSDKIYSSNKTIIFENCKFKNIQHNSQKLKLIFRNCTFNGNVSSGNIELYNCRIEKTLCDAMNPQTNFIAKNVYVRNLIHELSTSGAHVDGIQIFGKKDVISGNILIDNTRFSLPNLKYDGAKTYINAALMMQLEFGSAENVTFQNIIIDCGSPWAPCRSTKPFVLDDGTQLYEKNILFSNIKLSNHYKNCFYGDYYKDDITEKDITFPGLLYVTSIMQSEDGKTHIIVTNNTKEDKNLVVKSCGYKWYFSIPKQPAPIDVHKKEEYATLRYHDLPFDVICTIPQILQNGTCYDNDKIIQQFDFE